MLFSCLFDFENERHCFTQDVYCADGAGASSEKRWSSTCLSTCIAVKIKRWFNYNYSCS